MMNDLAYLGNIYLYLRSGVPHPPSCLLDSASWLLRRGIDTSTGTDTRVDMIRSETHVLNNAMPMNVWLSISRTDAKYLNRPREMISNAPAHYYVICARRSPVRNWMETSGAVREPQR